MFCLIGFSCSKEVAIENQGKFSNSNQAKTLLLQEKARHLVSPLSSTHQSALQIFQGIDTVALQNALNKQNANLNIMIASLASQIRSYLLNVHQVNHC